MRNCATSALFCITISDRYGTVSHIQGSSMHPTLAGCSATFPGYLRGDVALVEKFCLKNYKFSHGDVVIFHSPNNFKQIFVKRLLALPGDLIQVSSDVVIIPEGHCWVEGDNSTHSYDSRSFGPIPLGLIRGRVTHVVWPPQRIGKVERKMPAGRIPPY
ncbi:Chloroplast processing peptidase [Apostasia shenzhenica]|uniref:Mitochondrial inner membrane protease subunit 2 n=1 Tax=Apostasia shenzhenica TaxID=1088818 RepID=A0A2I0AN41_9ASPA|nr:Chloroplast processing peptidase [Apostasia shenzhenica]